MSSELATKLDVIRGVLERHGLGGVRFRGSDWFAWATCGGSNVVLLTAQTGVAEVLVTGERALVLTNVIERDRLRAEELPEGLEVLAGAWQTADADVLVARAAHGPVASDLPAGGERPLPEELVAAKRRMLPEEVERYRQLGRDAAVAVSEAMRAARPDWTERELAGAAAAELWRRGMHPALTLVGAGRRLPAYRHPTATAEPLGARAMLVVCARRHGLFANLTRFVYFREPLADELAAMTAVAEVEAASFAASRPGSTLGDAYLSIADAYAKAGWPGAENDHHQGGSTGYLSREAIAVPGSPVPIELGTPLAWNPSLPGAKLEDTVLVTDDGPEILTADPRWPTTPVDGRPRPDVLVTE